MHMLTHSFNHFFTTGSGMRSNWRKKDVNIAESSGIESNWRRKRSEEKKVVSQDIPVPKESISLIVGHRGCNIRRMENFKDVQKIIIDNSANKVCVTALNQHSLKCVSEEISSILGKVRILNLTKKSFNKGLRILKSATTDDLTFRSAPNCAFEVLRFCSLFGIDPQFVSKEMTISADYIQLNKYSEIKAFNEYWNTNMTLLDSEIIWRRHHITSNFIEELLVTSSFMRNFGTCSVHLNRLRCFPGVDYIEIVGSEEDVVLKLVIGARSRQELESCTASVHSLCRKHKESLRVVRLCKDEMKNSNHSFCIPYACKSSKFLKKSLDSGKSFLDIIFDDPAVVLVELNECDQTLTVGCTSEEKLNLLMFGVRGKMSFFKEFAWRKMYHGNFKYYIKVSDDQIMRDAIFKEFLIKEGQDQYLSADFTDFVDDGNLLYQIEILTSQRSNQDLQCYPRSQGSFALYKKSDVLSDFIRLSNFVDLPILENFQVHCEFGVSLFKLYSASRKEQPVEICNLLNGWENDFRGYFSFDFKASLKALFIKCLASENFKEICHQNFTDIYFWDLGNNVRFTARIENKANKGLTSEPVNIKYCKSDHMDNQIMDIDSSKCSIKIKATSQKAFSNQFATEFVERAMETGELEKDGFMSYDGRYSMYNVSTVDRTIYQWNDFVINLDCVSKKSNQRYGRFSNVLHLTLHSTLLNKAIHDLQKNSGDDQLKTTVMKLYEEFVAMCEQLTLVIDTHFAW